MYSNSSYDLSADRKGAVNDELAVRSMYERAPYPGLGDGLKDMSLFLDPIWNDLATRPQVRFLDAGCGTGHYLVGVATQHPAWQCYGIDLSQASLDVAGQLAALHGANIALKRGSYLEPLPFEGCFDVIAALGTIHHSADPLGALKNIRLALRNDGYLLLHLYGMRIDRQKFEIKEMLDLFEPDLTNVDRRFFFYNALMRHRRRNWLRQLAQMPLIDILSSGKIWLRNFLRRTRGTVWSPGFDARYDNPTPQWIDHFCHPCERAYEVPEVAELVRNAGFEVHRMLGQGREYSQLIPQEWRAEYDRLPDVAKWRLSELLAFRGGSFRMILRRT